MKEQALSIAGQTDDSAMKMNLLREYLQAFILRSFHESEAFVCLSFLGGTALRFLFGLPRFSEDLDFSLEGDRSHYHPDKWFDKLKRDLDFANFESTVSLKSKRTVHGAWVKVKGLLHEVGLSGLRDQNISIKIEIDSNPPVGSRVEKTVVNKYFLLALQHHDLSSLMAGKIHALCSRAYLKGRDYYDFFWYRSRRPPVEPNLTQLQAALQQTQAKPWDATRWKEVLKKKFTETDWDLVVKDVRPFLEHPDDAGLLTKEFLIKTISD